MKKSEPGHNRGKEKSLAKQGRDSQSQPRGTRLPMAGAGSKIASRPQIHFDFWRSSFPCSSRVLIGLAQPSEGLPSMPGTARAPAAALGLPFPSQVHILGAGCSRIMAPAEKNKVLTPVIEPLIAPKEKPLLLSTKLNLSCSSETSTKRGIGESSRSPCKVWDPMLQGLCASWAEFRGGQVLSAPCKWSPG